MVDVKKGDRPPLSPTGKFPDREDEMFMWNGKENRLLKGLMKRSVDLLSAPEKKLYFKFWVNCVV